MIEIIIIIVLVILLIVQTVRIRKSENEVILVTEKYVNKLQILRKVEEDRAFLTNQAVVVNKRVGVLIGMYINLLESNTFMYVNSNFHPNYSFYSGRFYVKVNKKRENNKAVAIPFIKDNNSVNKVIDLTKLMTSISESKGNILDKELNIKNLEVLIELLEKATIHKEDVIATLGNKMLKGYK